MRRTFLLPLLLCSATVAAHAQIPSRPLVVQVQPALASALPNAPVPQQTTVPADDREPKRILGLMPNYRAVSAGTHVPPPTPRESFGIATRNTFDYSSFLFVGLTSLIAEGNDSHPQLGKGVAGFGRYYWRGFADKADGNYWVIFVLPTAFHEDERYYALGHGSILHRSVYAASRVFITPNYHEHNTINGAELLGRGIAEGVSTTYYPSEDRSFGNFATKYGYALMRDGATNVFRELWPDIAVHILHQKQ